ncbi:MAG: hypothetical protein ACR2L6_07590 [Gemmatimonadaceae bacterium]
MSAPESLPWRATIQEYKHQANALFKALLAGDQSAQWRFKWNHPRFRDKTVDAVTQTTLSPADARVVVAHEHAFETWADLERFAGAVQTDGPIARFEQAVDAVVAGDVPALRAMLQDSPGLVQARSTRRHQATLLHYVGANGVEDARQKTPPNAVEVAKLLLDAGAEVDPSIADYLRTESASGPRSQESS